MRNGWDDVAAPLLITVFQTSNPEVLYYINSPVTFYRVIIDKMLQDLVREGLIQSVRALFMMVYHFPPVLT